MILKIKKNQNKPPQFFITIKIKDIPTYIYLFSVRKRHLWLNIISLAAMALKPFGNFLNTLPKPGFRSGFQAYALFCHDPECFLFFWFLGFGFCGNLFAVLFAIQGIMRHKAKTRLTEFLRSRLIGPEGRREDIAG